jgi:diguanylate cyclase (GGDEF)-like protein
LEKPSWGKAWAGETGSNGDRRAEERRPFAATVDYAYNRAERGGLVSRNAVGVSLNLSGQGLGIYSHEPLGKSQAVTLFSGQLHPEPIPAEVKWCEQVSNRIYKVGLMFQRRLQEAPIPAEAEAPAAAETPVQGDAPPVEAEAPAQLGAPHAEAPGAGPGPAEEWRQAIDVLRGQMEVVESSLGRRIAELTEANERLRAISVLDDLTGVHNRRYFFERLEAERTLLDRYGHSLSVMFLDIDDFKVVNDRFGHMAGDALLRELSEIVKRNLRKGDVFARYGGEEFAAILPHTGGEAALAAAENIRRQVESTRFIALEGKQKLTVSIGVVEVGRDTPNIREALRHADDALYEAKRRGKNRAILWPWDGGEGRRA